jgi:hypothetical protein
MLAGLGAGLGRTRCELGGWLSKNYHLVIIYALGAILGSNLANFLAILRQMIYI